MILRRFREACFRMSCYTAPVTVFIVVFIVLTVTAGPASRHTAEIAAVVRGVLAGLSVALAAAVAGLTIRAVSVQPAVRRHLAPDDDLPPPVQPEPGWVTVASVHRLVPAPPVPVPGRPALAPEPGRPLRKVR